MNDMEGIAAGAMQPECVNTKLFRRTMESICKSICSDIDESVMQECYGKLLGNNPAITSKVHSRFIDLVESQFKERINELIKEENINEKFLQLQKLEEGSSKENITWLPSRDCLSDIRSHDCQKQIQLKRELEVLVAEEEAKLEKMKIKVEDARKQQVKLHDKVSYFNDISCKLNSCTENMEVLIENTISDFKPSPHIYQ